MYNVSHFLPPRFKNGVRRLWRLLHFYFWFFEGPNFSSAVDYRNWSGDCWVWLWILVCLLTDNLLYFVLIIPMTFSFASQLRYKEVDTFSKSQTVESMLLKVGVTVKIVTVEIHIRIEGEILVVFICKNGFHRSICFFWRFWDRR